MKKGLLITIGFFILILSVPPAALAGTVGNTAAVNTLSGPGTFSLKKERNISLDTSADIDILLSRDISAGDATGVKLENSQWYMFKIGYRFFDTFEPYVRLGGAHLVAKWTDRDSGIPVKMDTSSAFAWGVGLKSLIYEVKSPRIKIIGDASYRTADLDPYQAHLSSDLTDVNRRASLFIIREWQASLLAATEMDLGYMLNRWDVLKGYTLSPYAGVKWSQLSGRLRLVTATGAEYHPDNLKSERTFGLIVGSDLVLPGDSFAVNVEGRFVDETALSTGVSLLF